MIFIAMGNSLECYRSELVLLCILKGSKCSKTEFWCTVVLLFYMEAIYLQVLKAIGYDNYCEIMQ